VDELQSTLELIEERREKRKQRLSKENLEYLELKEEDIIKTFGQWAITTDGLDSLDTYYPIHKSRLEKEDWLRQVSQKSWVNMSDFAVAYVEAVKYFNKQIQEG